MQLEEIQQSIELRRNRIFLLMEEVRRLRIQQRVKVTLAAPPGSAVASKPATSVCGGTQQNLASMHICSAQMCISAKHTNCTTVATVILVSKSVAVYG